MNLWEVICRFRNRLEKISGADWSFFSFVRKHGDQGFIRMIGLTTDNKINLLLIGCIEFRGQNKPGVMEYFS